MFGDFQLYTSQVKIWNHPVTLPETNIAPEKQWFEAEFPFGPNLVSGVMLVRGGEDTQLLKEGFFRLPGWSVHGATARKQKKSWLLAKTYS